MSSSKQRQRRRSGERVERHGSRVRTSVEGDPKARVAGVQRARMLGAAARIVGEAGYGGMSVSRIAGRAGVSRRTFYEQFEDREDCFLALFEEALDRAGGVARDAWSSSSPVGGDGGWSVRVRAGLFALLALAEDEPALGSLLVVEPLGAGPRVLESRARALQRLKTVVDRGRAQASERARRDASSSSSPSSLTAEGVVGSVLSVVHARLLEQVASLHANGSARPRVRPGSLTGLVNPLMAMIVLPYLGQAAAARELACPAPKSARASWGSRGPRAAANPLQGLGMRLTQRTLLVLTAIAEHPGASNRRIADLADVHDQGQMSKLLYRLKRLGLIANANAGLSRGEANAWELTDKGREIELALRS